MNNPIYIQSYDCLTPAGRGVSAMMESLFAGRTHLTSQDPVPHGSLPYALHQELQQLTSEKPLRDQDAATLMGVTLARALRTRVRDPFRTGLIIGSSRGPTQSLEKTWADFAEGKRLRPTASPTTTASSLASVVARDVALEGPSFFLSAACSTGLYSVIQGATTLLAGLCQEMLVGGVEASNTLFTFEMLQAARVLSMSREAFPCQPGAEGRQGMVLSEGAALLLLDNHHSDQSVAQIIGFGAATEGGTLTGVSEQGDALVRAIQNALEIANLNPQDIDLIVGHGAGTVKGDKAEIAAYQSLFAANPNVALVWHKWCGGHMLGASAALSVMLAIEHLKVGLTPPHPYFPQHHPMRHSQALLRNEVALITSMGFGGSACAVLVKNLS